MNLAATVFIAANLNALVSNLHASDLITKPSNLGVMDHSVGWARGVSLGKCHSNFIWYFSDLDWSDLVCRVLRILLCTM